MRNLLAGVRTVVAWAGKRLAVLVPAFVVLLWLISFSPFWFSEATIKADHGVGTLDLRFASSVAAARSTLDQLGPAGRRAYGVFQLVDIVFPLSYALALGGLVWRLWRGEARRWVVYLAAVPLVGAAFDYLENVLVRVALGTYPTPGDGVLAAQVTVTSVKLVLSYASQAAVVVGLVVGGVGWLGRRRRADRTDDGRGTVGAATKGR